MTTRTEPATFPATHHRAPVNDRGDVARAARWVAAAAAGFAAVAAGLGLVADGIYTGDAATAEMLRGYDAVTLAAAMMLAVAVRPARHEPVRGRLLIPALLTYLAYTYAYHLFGTGFNDLLLLHAAVFACSLAGLALFFTSVRADELVDGTRSGTPVRVAAVLLGLLAAALGALWVYTSISYAVTGDIPTGSALVETPAVVHLGIALDLALLVPLYGTAAVLLWRRTGLGFVLATVALVAGLLHQATGSRPTSPRRWASPESA